MCDTPQPPRPPVSRHGGPLWHKKNLRPPGVLEQIAGTRAPDKEQQRKKTAKSTATDARKQSQTLGNLLKIKDTHREATEIHGRKSMEINGKP